MRLLDIPFGAAIALAIAAGAGGLAQEARAAGLLVPSGSPDAPLEIASHKVAVEIDDGIARTRVEQVFRNRTGAALEAVYRFPVPADAALSHFSMWIGGRELTGEVVERRRAREVYEQITQTKRDPGLVEQTSYKLFECRVFPVPASGEQRIAIEYLQPVELDHGVATYTYPLETRAASGSVVTGELSVTVDVRSAVPLARVECPSHGARLAAARLGGREEKDLFSTSDSEDAPRDRAHSRASDLSAARSAVAGHHRFSYEARGATLDDDLVIRYELERSETGIDVVAEAPPDDDGTFLLTLTPGDELEASLAPMDVVFLVDVSGSMSYEGRMDVAHRALAAFLEGLRPVDRFQVVLFNVAPQPLLEQLAEPEPEAVRGVLSAVAARTPGGGTDIFPALQMALAERSPGRARGRAVVIISDGQANEGDEQHARFVDLLRREGQGVRVFAFGVGNEVNRPLLARLAEETGGLGAWIASTDDIEARVEALRAKLERPAATGIEVRFEPVHASGRRGAEVSDLVPAGPHTLHAGSQVRVYGRFRRGGGRGRFIATGDVAGERREWVREVLFPAAGQGERRPELARMWAWRTMDRLAERARVEGEKPELRDRGTAIGVRYGVVGPWTSFLVLESEEQYARFGIERRNPARREAEAAVFVERRVAADAARAAGSYPTAVPVAERPSGVGSGRHGGGSSGAGFVALLAGAGFAARRLASRKQSRKRDGSDRDATGAHG